MCLSVIIKKLVNKNYSFDEKYIAVTKSVYWFFSSGNLNCFDNFKLKLLIEFVWFLIIVCWHHHHFYVKQNDITIVALMLNNPTTSPSTMMLSRRQFFLIFALIFFCFGVIMFNRATSMVCTTSSDIKTTGFDSVDQRTKRAMERQRPFIFIGLLVDCWFEEYR